MKFTRRKCIHRLSPRAQEDQISFRHWQDQLLMTHRPRRNPFGTRCATRECAVLSVSHTAFDVDQERDETSWTNITILQPTKTMHVFLLFPPPGFSNHASHYPGRRRPLPLIRRQPLVRRQWRPDCELRQRTRSSKPFDIKIANFRNI